MLRTFLVGVGDVGELGDGAVQDCVHVESTPACRDGVVRERVEFVVGELAQRLAQVGGSGSGGGAVLDMIMAGRSGGSGGASETSFGEAGEETPDGGSASVEVWVRGVDQSLGWELDAGSGSQLGL